MNISCDVIWDLIPLYVENIASEASATFVREHIKKCPECRTALEDFKVPVALPLGTDTKSLRILKSRVRKRTILSAITAIMLMLTMLVGLAVYMIAPVWLSVDEAVVMVEQEESGRIRVLLSDRVSRITNLGNDRFCVEGVRCDWLLKAYRKQIPNSSENYLYFTLEEGQSLWYAGQYTSEGDTLLFGTDTLSSEGGYYREMDRSLLYILWICSGVGSVFLICGYILRKKRLGKVFLVLASLFLSCAASCAFVTGGHFYASQIRHISMLRFSSLATQYAAIGVMTLISFITILIGSFTICAYNND